MKLLLFLMAFAAILFIPSCQAEYVPTLQPNLELEASSIAVVDTATVPELQTTHQCEGITVKGVQCKQMVYEGRYCFSHDPTAPRCGGMTSKGTPCKRRVTNRGDHCISHSITKLTGGQ